MEELRKELKKENPKYNYDIDGLMELMKPYKISTDDIKAYNKKNINRSTCTFISIYRCYPKTHINVEICREVNIHGDIITMSDKVFRSCIPGLYSYSEESLDTILKWQKGHKLILEIDKELIRMDIHNIEKVKDYIINLMEAEAIKKTVDKRDTQNIDISNLKEMIKNGAGIEVSNI